MEKAAFISLIDKYLAGTASEAEQALLEAYYTKLETKGITNLSAEQEAHLRIAIFDSILPANPLHGGVDASVAGTMEATMRRGRGGLRTIYRLTAAAAAIIVIISSYWLFFNNKPSKPVQQLAIKEISPGRDAAILTLSGGEKIYLDSVTGKINESTINNNGQLIYSQNNSDKIQYHTLTTSRGNQYKIVLPDGSKLMLNSATSIKYPSAFIDRREVELMYGEAYFEIEKNKSKPFIIKINEGKQPISSNGGVAPTAATSNRNNSGIGTGVSSGETIIEVLGTTFNINNYKEEGAAATTLITGSVKISNNKTEKIMEPGQQAIYSNHLFNISEADITKTIAWTTGFFEFDKMDLKSIMRQISRWYDIDIIYENSYPSENDARFGGRISRNLPLSNILKLLEANGLKFRLEGNKLIIR